MNAPIPVTALQDPVSFVELHRTQRSRLESIVEASAFAELDRVGSADGDLFILAADGSYDVELNRFFRELPSWRVRSKNSRDAYTRDVMLYCRFLMEERGGKTIWQCDPADLRAYKKTRLEPESGNPVSLATWRRSIASLDKWVEWAMYEKLLKSSPFRYVEKSVMTPSGRRLVRVNAEQEPDLGDRTFRYLPFEDYLLWRDVGLRGELPGGGPDPTWRGRHGERNAAFADLLVFTGMRLGEASSLLVPEVPAWSGARAASPLTLAAATTKGKKSRTVFVNQRTLQKLHQYASIERDELVARRLAAGGYPGIAEPVLLSRYGSRSVTVCGRSKSLSIDTIGVEERQRLFSAAPGGSVRYPLWLWLGDDGLPLKRSTWQSAFRRANARCSQFGITLPEVHPHMLRHTFAVQMLGLLLRQTVRALGMRPDRGISQAEIRRLLIGNPMRKLQLLLGHSQESTVYLYLDVLDEAQEIVLAAMAEWELNVAEFEGDDGTGGVR